MRKSFSKLTALYLLLLICVTNTEHLSQMVDNASSGDVTFKTPTNVNSHGREKNVKYFDSNSSDYNVEKTKLVEVKLEKVNERTVASKLSSPLEKILPYINDGYSVGCVNKSRSSHPKTVSNLITASECNQFASPYGKMSPYFANSSDGPESEGSKGIDSCCGSEATIQTELEERTGEYPSGAVVSSQFEKSTNDDVINKQVNSHLPENKDNLKNHLPVNNQLSDYCSSERSLLDLHKDSTGAPASKELRRESKAKFDAAVSDYRLEMYKKRCESYDVLLNTEDKTSTLETMLLNSTVENVKVKTEKEWLRQEVMRMHQCFETLSEKFNELSVKNEITLENSTARLEKAFEQIHRVRCARKSKMKWFKRKCQH